MLNFLSEIKILKEYILESYTIPKTVISSIAGWTTTYFLIKKIAGQEPEWAARAVTTVHATVVSFLAILDWFFIRDWNLEMLGQVNSKFEEAILCLTLGYFFFDLVWIIKYQTEGPLMCFHHAASILFLLLILAKGISGPEVLMGLSGLEVTNPCLQARWFLRNHGYRGTRIYIITEFVFMSSFLIFRIFCGTYVTYSIITHPKSHLVLKLLMISFYLLSWVFAYQMLLYVNKRYLKPKEIKEN